MERTDFEQWKSREVARLLALVETERRYYQEMVASLPVALAVLGANRCAISANRAFRQLVGVRGDGLRTKTIEQLLPVTTAGATICEHIRETQQVGRKTGPFLYHGEGALTGKLLRIALVPIRSGDEDAEPETLLVIEDLTGTGAGLEPLEQEAAEAEAVAQEESADQEQAIQEQAIPAALMTAVDEPGAISEIQAEPQSEGLLEAQAFAAPLAEVLEAGLTEAAELPDAAEAPEMAQPATEVPSVVAPSLLPEFPTADLPAVVWRANPETLEFEKVSGITDELLGFPVEHWLQTPGFFAKRIHPADAESTVELYRSAIDGKVQVSAEFRAFDALGGVVWCRETVRVTEAGELVGVLTDITRRKRLEESILTAERVNALQGISGRLAHDLNNPLMIITGYAEELQHSFPEGDVRKEDASQILLATERISGLTSQLLTYARRRTPDLERTDVTGFLASFEQAFSAQEQAAESPLEVRIEERIWVLANAPELETMLGSMLKLVAPANPVVSAGVALITDQIPGSPLEAGAYARITVGEGPEAPTLNFRPFEAFLTKDASQQPAAAVAHAYQMVREWGGDLTGGQNAKGRPVFSIYLPLQEPDEEEIAEEPAAEAEVPVEEPTEMEAVAPVEAAPEVPPPAPPKLKILVVDDEPGIRALVAKILRREGYDVLEAGSGAEATLAANRDTEFALLLTDLMLPDIGGRQLAESILEKRRGLKVVYVSGFTDDELASTGSYPPGSLFLQKPFTLGSLVGKVKEALEVQA